MDPAMRDLIRSMRSLVELRGGSFFLNSRDLTAGGSVQVSASASDVTRRTARYISPLPNWDRRAHFSIPSCLLPVSVWQADESSTLLPYLEHLER